MTNFSITSEPIISSELKIQLQDPDCGAIATFTGIVRQHNINRDVIQLHYQSYISLATKEGNVILGEAIKQFKIVFEVVQPEYQVADGIDNCTSCNLNSLFA